MMALRADDGRAFWSSRRSRIMKRSEIMPAQQAVIAAKRRIYDLGFPFMMALRADDGRGFGLSRRSRIMKRSEIMPAQQAVIAAKRRIIGQRG